MRKFVGLIAVFFVASMWGVPSASALVPTTIRESVYNTGAQSPNGSVHRSALSADGRYAAFSSIDKLDTADTDTTLDIYVRDNVAGTTTLVPTTNGLEAISISADGRYVSYTAIGPFLADAGLYDRTTDTVVEYISAPFPMVVDPGPISADGKLWFYTTYEADMGGGTGSEVTLHRYKLANQVTQTFTPACNLIACRGTIEDASETGRHVSYYAAGAETPAVDVAQTYRYDWVSGTNTLVSKTPGGAEGNQLSAASSISDDGLSIAFHSLATDLVAGDDAGWDIFSADITSGAVSLVSRSSGGANGNGDSFNTDMSSDGRFVTYESQSTNITAKDSEPLMDIYRFDALLNKTTLMSVSTTGANGNNESFQAHVTSNGKKVLFRSTANNLIAGDTNNKSDIFLRG